MSVQNNATEIKKIKVTQKYVFIKFDKILNFNCSYDICCVLTTVKKLFHNKFVNI